MKNVAPLLFGLLAAFVAACGVGNADFDVSLAAANTTYELYVYDGSGLVTGVDQLPNTFPRPPGIDGPVADSQNQQLDIQWVTGACRHDNVMRLTGDATHLNLTLQPDVNTGFTLPLPESCASVGIILSAQLSLSEPVTQNAVTYELVQ